MTSDSRGDSVLNAASTDSENLYLEHYHGSLPIRSQIVLFVLNYCRSGAFKVIFCNTDIKTMSTSCKNPSLCIPNDLEHDWIDLKDIPDVVLQSCFPSVLTSNGLLCCVGLCIVLRRIVQQTHNKYPERNLISLLGFQQNCLKGFAEGSSWTKYCEIDLPADLQNCLHNIDTVPVSIRKLEKCLSLPVKISNQQKHQRKLRKIVAEKTDTTDVVSQTSNSGMSSEETASRQESDVVSYSSEESKKDRFLKKHRNVQYCEEPDNKHIDLASGSDGRLQIKTASSELSIKSKLKRAAEESLPELEHIFAEGISMTLTDLVVFPCIHLLYKAMQNGHMAMFKKNPLVLKWYHRMWNLPEIKECAEACGMRMVIPTEDLPMISNSDDESQPEIEVPNSEGTGMKEAKPVSKHGMRLAIQRKAATLLKTINDGGYVLEYMDHPSANIKILWDELPPQVHPAYGDVPSGRSERKCQQIENIVAAVKLIAEPGDKVVDFCSGGGHLGIVLASVLPECHIILVESKEVSLTKGLNRVKELGLKNATFYLGNIDYYHGSFNIGVSLHACGVATDMVITRCVQTNASFASSPCCYGAVRDTHVITYPRSEKLRNRPISYEDYRILAHAAEHTSWDFDSDRAKEAKLCMACIDSDRLFYTRQYGYRVWMTTMQPFTCTPKNNLLIGVAESRQHKLQTIAGI
ncbi:glutathione S-transferase C-terminal domain-containing protein-like [Anneissia japonica]|uniref:glutathione S-transferase C-terminal domain-containing protein-like n=1 Tax=Anneissia japonica TaxID=1529436 RepID=UPI0014258DC4|nr:glutathione S-transferase C-terminal domain-containing protein-like [Anneissia japonica]